MALQVPVIDSAGVAAALPLGACIGVMEDALRAYDRGAAVQPMRSVIQLPESSGSLYTMPAFIAEPRALTVKMITVFPDNRGSALPTHQGIVVAFDPQTGAPSLVIDAERLTAIRTAAVSAVATRALARADASVLAVLGTGVQARSHIEAMVLVRPIHEVRVWGRSAARAQQLARQVMHGFTDTDGYGTASDPLEVSTGRAAPNGINVIVCDTAADAVGDADIVCTTTAAREPVLRGEWLRHGAHINAVGASTGDSRELDSAAVAGARIFVDSIDAALTEAGDLLIPLSEHMTDVREWTPIGAVLNGNAAGRATDDEITLFKSVGLAIEDAAAAAHIARQRLTPGGGGG